MREAFIFEREAFAAIPWSPEVIFAFVGYVACLFTMYTLTPHLLQRADATVVLAGSWELFADAVLDVDWLTAGGADVVVAHRDAPWPPRSGAFANATVRLSCADAYYCGGVCDGQADAADAAWPGSSWRGARAGGQNRKTRSPGLYARDDEPALCGYAQLAPPPELRAGDGALPRLHLACYAPLANVVNDSTVEVTAILNNFDKFGALLSAMLRVMPRKRWYLKLDTDTVLVPENLLRFLSFFSANARQPTNLYFGHAGELPPRSNRPARARRPAKTTSFDTSCFL